MIMKKNNDKLFGLMHDYFAVFLPHQKKSSPHTILAAKQVWNLLLSFVCDRTNKRVEKLRFEDISREIVVRFLDEMQHTRGWSPSTRNHRLARVRSFFRYVADIEPTLVIHLDKLRGIPMQKDVNKSFVLEYMLKDSIAALLRQPDVSKKVGIRDQFFMILMYDSAARDSEMLSMRFGDFDPTGKVVYLLGKGNKPRSVPISDDTVQHFRRYAMNYHSTNEASTPMFYTVRHGKKGAMSDDNVARFLKQYSDSARVKCPEIPLKVHPHLLRKSRAMALYQAGMPLELLAQFLGHQDPTTTLIYARADNEMKRMAIEKAAAVTGPVSPTAKEAIWIDNEDMIKRLLGLV
jgi:site-specific recombinase XerD